MAAIDQGMPPFQTLLVGKQCNNNAIVRLLKEALHKAQNRTRQYANKKRSERSFDTRTWVYVKLQPYVQTSVRLGGYNKLSPKFFGPYLIIEKIGVVAYRLDLPKEAQIHPVFHVSLLKKANGPPTQVSAIPTIAPRFSLQPLKILDSRVTRRRNRVAGQVLVQWKDLPTCDATWEFRDEFQYRFPDFQL
ncbi:uncharacterized protein LOC143601094 [Bidens hawaiensis]|uniref:uncharacterized protein LOC143601094 n=1 Tax=Bidens hawaiensis TaxID=980011 RepID=UPI00404B7B5C